MTRASVASPNIVALLLADLSIIQTFIDINTDFVVRMGMCETISTLAVVGTDCINAG